MKRGQPPITVNPLRGIEREAGGKDKERYQLYAAFCKSRKIKPAPYATWYRINRSVSDFNYSFMP